MSGIQMMILAADAGFLTGQSGGVTNTALTTGIRSGTFTLVNDGTFTGTGASSGNWFSPTTSGVGSSWSVKATINSTTNTSFSGTTGSWVSASGMSWSMQNSATNAEGLGSFTIAFSPDGGTTTAGTMSVTWDVGYTP